MSLLVVGVNHRSGPLPLLERLIIAPDDLAKRVSGLALRDDIREAVVLSTCNRTEVYVYAERFHGAYADVRDFLCELGGLDVDELAPHLFSQHDEAAVAHLFEVAAGLDSAVLGEGEILGQIRTAWQVAKEETAARAGMNLLMRSAVAAGKRARSESAIGRGTASVSHAAVEMLADVVGDLTGKHVAVIGAGSMGEGVAVALHKSGGADICVVNRSPERGAALAERVGATALGFDRLEAALAAADVVVTSTGSGEPVITVEVLRRARAKNAGPLHIIDIAVPRDVEADVGDLDDVSILDLDDLRDWADRGLAKREKEAELVRRIILEEVENFAVEQTSRQAAPLIVAMHRAAESIRTAELDRFANRLSDLSDADRSSVEALTKAIVSKLLHEPSIRLKSDAGTPQGDRNSSAVRDLFGLG